MGVQGRDSGHPGKCAVQRGGQALAAIEKLLRQRAASLPQSIVQHRIPRERQESLALRWIVDAATSRKGTPMKDALAAEIVDAYNNTGTVVKKKEDTHKMAQANRAFAHLRW